MTEITLDTMLTNGVTVRELLTGARRRKKEARWRWRQLQRTPSHRRNGTVTEAKTLADIATGHLQGVTITLTLLGLPESELEKSWEEENGNAH